jgi:hypothetical protein
MQWQLKNQVLIYKNILNNYTQTTTIMMMIYTMTIAEIIIILINHKMNN